MHSSIRSFAKALSHRILGPGGATRHLGRIRLVTRSLFYGVARWGVVGAPFRALLLGAYRYELAAAASGIARHLSTSNSDYRLRRNVHRLEKGLTMRNRRAVFGRDFIVETIHDLRASMSRGRSSTQAWAIDVLTLYFESIDTEAFAETRIALDEFRRLDLGDRRKGYLADRYPDHCGPIPKPPSDIGYDDLLQLFRSRSSVRFFHERPVPADLLEKALSAASCAPSACNRQPFSFRVCRGDSAIHLASLARGTAGYVDQIPCCIAVVGDLSAIEGIHDRHVIYIDSSLATMQFLLALESMGLASCTINWPEDDSRNRRAARLLELEKFERIVMLIAVGYPDHSVLVPGSLKKSASELMVKL